MPSTGWSNKFVGLWIVYAAHVVAEVKSESTTWIATRVREHYVDDKPSNHEALVKMIRACSCTLTVRFFAFATVASDLGNARDTYKTVFVELLSQRMR